MKSFFININEKSYIRYIVINNENITNNKSDTIMKSFLKDLFKLINLKTALSKKLFTIIEIYLQTFFLNISQKGI